MTEGDRFSRLGWAAGEIKPDLLALVDRPRRRCGGDPSDDHVTLYVDHGRIGESIHIPRGQLGEVVEELNRAGGPISLEIEVCPSLLGIPGPSGLGGGARQGRAGAAHGNRRGGVNAVATARQLELIAAGREPLRLFLFYARAWAEGKGPGRLFGTAIGALNLLTC